MKQFRFISIVVLLLAAVGAWAQATVQVKLAELIIAVEGAHNKLANCEEMSEEELTELHEQYRQQASVAKQALDSRRDGKKAKSGSPKKAMAGG